MLFQLMFLYLESWYSAWHIVSAQLIFVETKYNYFVQVLLFGTI